MTPRTLKEVAQAGLILGFEWIARDENGKAWLYRRIKPTYEDDCADCESGRWFNGGYCNSINPKITDYPNLPPEKSLLKLSDIVEDKA